MGFRPSTYNIARFNSATSSEFLSFYQNFVIQQILDDNTRKPHEAFAPSSFRCDRLCWFRLRGVEPDIITNPDPVMQFKADLGTSCHITIQRNMVKSLGDDWIDPEQYLKDYPMPWEYKLTRNGLECFVEIFNPPVRFACDGIVRWKGKICLLEIKTVEYSALEDMTDPRQDHIDQVECYSTLLNIDTVLFLYQDRQYGGLKCYEFVINKDRQKAILDKIYNIMDMKNNNLAPSKLASNDSMCNMCKYKIKCRQWGG